MARIRPWHRDAHLVEKIHKLLKARKLSALQVTAAKIILSKYQPALKPTDAPISATNDDRVTGIVRTYVADRDDGEAPARPNVTREQRDEEYQALTAARLAAVGPPEQYREEVQALWAASRAAAGDIGTG